MEKEYGLPYYPHISVGWDNNPRFNGFRPGIVKNNPPEEVKKGFVMRGNMQTAIRDRRRLLRLTAGMNGRKQAIWNRMTGMDMGIWRL